MSGEPCATTSVVTLFKDPVHGYIEVPKEYCRRFVDTPIFQRLRSIEQTSMRPLFPGARHDRFIHSLGVYHLGMRMYSALERNTDDETLRRLLTETNLRETFRIACLMHDCGHAPFSHTSESFYNFSDGVGPKHAFSQLPEVLGHSDFVVGEEGAFKPAPHEAVSAVVLHAHYGADATKEGWDLSLACRMITGCTIPSPNNDQERIQNALIGLLNGEAIDCDKLDYIVRDTWASGVKNTAVDIDRLLNSYCLVRDGEGVRVCHRNAALSVIQTVVDARNYLFEWVYSHHTVLYHSALLRRALEKLAVHLSKDNTSHHFWEAVFSEKAFAGPQSIAGFHVHMPTDADLSYMLKASTEEAGIAEYREILGRAPSRFALWKTYAEYHRTFEDAPLRRGVNPKVYLSIQRRIPESFAGMLGCAKDDIIVVDAEPKHYSIGDGDIWVRYPDGSIGTFSDVFEDPSAGSSRRHFYVFVPNRFRDRSAELIGLVKNMER